MATITAITPQRRSGRFNVMVDDAFTLAISESVLVDLHLHVGDEVDPQQLTTAADAENNAQAVAASLRLLESRQRSQREIEDRLKRRGYDPAVISSVTTKLTEYGLINDVEFSAMWVDSRSRCQPSGKIKLKSELLQKGIGPETIMHALECISEDQEYALARAALRKKPLPSGKDQTERQKEYIRLANFLCRRGFSWHTIKLVLKERLDIETDA